MSTATPTLLPPADTRPALSHGDGDHDLFSHYVDKNKVTDAYVFGTELDALCGKKWVPTRDPDRFPVCPSCADRLAALVADATGRD